MENQTSKYWIDHLALLSHPEGGYFKETYRSANSFLPDGFTQPRSYATSIYFLLEENNVSHFHRIQSDELWYYHAGASLTVYVIHQNGHLEKIKIGPHIDQGEVLQATVPANTIFGSTCEGDYSLVGCMVSPGFDFNDFELFTTSNLLLKHPNHAEVIKKLTKEVY